MAGESAQSSVTRVVIADDHPVVRSGLRLLLDAEPDLEVTAEAGDLGPINAAVDACNIVSLHSGLPISVVDTARALPPFRIAVAGPGERYVFNRSGQEIDLAGLVCFYDRAGACANAVRDAQRTKTTDDTRATLTVVWGVAGYEQRVAAVVQWYRELVARLGGSTE